MHGKKIKNYFEFAYLLVYQKLIVFSLAAVNFKKLSNLGISNLFINFRIFIKPWYHSFSKIGFRTPQNVMDNYKRTQRTKSSNIFPLINDALTELARSKTGDIKAVDLFASDSYFGIATLQMNNRVSMIAIDLLEGSGEGEKRINHGDQAILAAKILGLDNRFEYRKMSVLEFNQSVDLIINTGGLYHIENPKKLLENLRRCCSSFMVLQTIVHEEFDFESFFETPAPNWTWGSRFSMNYLRQIVAETNWKIRYEAFHIVDSNLHQKDRGSAYMLLEAI